MIAATIEQSTKDEYNRLRLGVGLTSYAHYQAFDISGADATGALNRLILSDLTRLPIGRILATYMLREDGSLLADVLIWNQGGHFLLLAETRESDSLEAWIQQHAPDVLVRNLSGEAAFVGLDGPFAWEVLKETVGVRMLGLRYLETMTDQKIGGIAVDILRAGKTGEFGYMLKTRASDAEALEEALLEAGKEFHLERCGAPAVDLCKLENRFTNVYKEGASASNVLELNCRIQVSSEKEEYIGRGPIEEAMTSGKLRRLIGIKIAGLATPPENSIVEYKGEKIGDLVTSGYSWTLGEPVGLALLLSEYAYVGCTYDIAGQFAGTTVSAPFVLNKSIQIRPQEDSFKTVDWSFKP